MWQWINQNASALSFLATLGTLAVWLFYAQLLYLGFKRQRKARILINQGWGQQIDSVCLVSIMSQEPVYIHSLLMTIRTDGHQYTESITDFDSAQPKDSEDHPQQVTRQGPLNAGEQINLGTFRSLIRQTGKRHKHLEEDDKQPIRTLAADNCKITVIASYGPEGGVIGAQRKFYVSGDDNELMRPAATTTKTMAKRRARKHLQQWLEDQL